MARKRDPEFEVLASEVEDEPRKKKGAAAHPRRPRYWLASTAVVVAIIAAFYGYQQIERLLIRDARFRLETPEPGEQSTGIRLAGVSKASRSAVLNVFAHDYGRSVYLLPLAERRRNLLAVEWVKDASLSRVWPNRVDVLLTEREPVAFVELPSGDSAAPLRFALIDIDGVILEPQSAVRYQLPVLSGITPQTPEAVRRDRVRRALKLFRDIGPMAQHISQIDVADSENFKIWYEVNRKVIVLLAGNQRFRQRLENFVNHYDDIRRRMPEAAVLDLRLEDRITAVQGGAE